MWNEQRVGIALTVGGIAGILTQTPAGALVASVAFGIFYFFMPETRDKLFLNPTKGEPIL